MNLIANFSNGTNSEYERAKSFIKNESMFYGEGNNEFMSIYFPVDSNEEANVLETELIIEFIERGFKNYYFELE